MKSHGEVTFFLKSQILPCIKSRITNIRSSISRVTDTDLQSDSGNESRVTLESGSTLQSDCELVATQYE